MQTTKSIFDRILASSLFRLDGERLDLPSVIIELCDAIKSEEETDWSLGECDATTLDSFLVGAYWALAEWHGGQASDTYAALCAIGGIFSPGMTSTPAEDDSEWEAYSAVNECFASR